MNALIQKAKQIIADNIYMTVATASPDGKPWVSPVFFAYDQDYNLFWISNKNSLHSKLIRSNPQIAIVIFDSQAPEGKGDAVYFEAEVTELEDTNQLELAIETLGKRATKEEFKAKSVREVTEAATWRIYKAVPKVISTLVEGECVNGQYVDKRVEIDLGAALWLRQD